LSDFDTVRSFGDRTGTTTAFVPQEMRLQQKYLAEPKHDWWMLGMTVLDMMTNNPDREVGAGRNPRCQDVMDHLVTVEIPQAKYLLQKLYWAAVYRLRKKATPWTRFIKPCCSLTLTQFEQFSSYKLWYANNKKLVVGTNSQLKYNKFSSELPDCKKENECTVGFANWYHISLQKSDIASNCGEKYVKVPEFCNMNVTNTAETATVHQK
jgi:hypothetical protein